MTGDVPHLDTVPRGWPWRDIASYPRCENCDDPNCNWGPETLLLFPYEHGPFVVVGHKEAGMWLSRAAEDPEAWSELAALPTHWAPIPSPLPAPPVLEERIPEGLPRK